MFFLRTHPICSILCLERPSLRDLRTQRTKAADIVDCDPIDSHTREHEEYSVGARREVLYMRQALQIDSYAISGLRNRLYLNCLLNGI